MRKKLTIEEITKRCSEWIMPLKRIGKDKNNYWLIQCQCNRCGNTFLTRYSNIISKNTTSCGCFHKIKITKHGHSKKSGHSSEYNSWDNMIQRCTNKKRTGYNYYGGRGIKNL